MSKTYRNRQRSIGYYQNEEHMMSQVWYSNYYGTHAPIYEKGDWERAARDKCHMGSSKRNYREWTNEIIRNKNRNDIHRIMKDPENYDDMTFATKMDGKHIAWAIW